jgi:hypothetical protein
MVYKRRKRCFPVARAEVVSPAIIHTFYEVLEEFVAVCISLLKRL